MSELGFRTSGRVRPRRARGCVAVILALAVLAGILAFAAVKGQEFLAEAFTVPDYSGPGEGAVVVQVAQGASNREIGAALESKGVVQSAEAFTRAARKDSRALGIQPGYYRLRERMAATEALSLILDPTARILDRVTIPEGRRLSQTLAILSKKSAISESAFTRALKDSQSLGLAPYANGKPEGVLFPSTYDLDPGTTAASLLQDMAARHIAVAEKLHLTEGAKQLGRTPLEVVTVASLIEAEGRRPEDFPKIARVIYNRLDDDLRLQMDSTVHYAINKYVRPSTTAKERANPSPYNTYKVKGLPPGPINAPGERALAAALHPASGKWLYFVTTNPDSGETKFASTYTQHDAFVREFQKWCRANSDRC